MTRGEMGERLAEQFLVERGFTIVTRNFRTRFGEIDLIVRKDEFLIFVEVKLRKSNRFGEPREAVTAAKRRKLILAAEEWIALHGEDGYMRFDVVEVLTSGSAAVQINHLQNAFDASD